MLSGKLTKSYPQSFIEMILRFENCQFRAIESVQIFHFFLNVEKFIKIESRQINRRK